VGGVVNGVEKQQRIARARQALLQAETAVGLHQRLPVQQATTPPQGTGERHGSVRHDAEHFGLPAALQQVLPAGLRPGSTVEVRGSNSLLLAMGAAAMAHERWIALVGLPHLGVPAAAEAGVALQRTVVVPSPGARAAEVVAALIEGFDVLVLGAGRQLRDRDRRLVLARLRSRGAVLLSTNWPGSDLQLVAHTQHTTGLGQGWGAVAERRVELLAGGRLLGGQEHRLVLRFDGAGLHDDGGAVSPGDEGRPRLRAVS